MSFNISNNKKIEIIENVINRLQESRYSIIVSAGENPDTFIVHEISEDEPSLLDSLYLEINSIDEKIANLQTLVETLS